MSNKLNELTLKQCIDGLKNNKFNEKELCEEVLKRTAEVEPKIHSYITVNKNCIEKKGIPYAAKDVLSAKDLLTTASSKILGDYIPAYNATVVEKLNSQDVSLIGKTNCDAFAFGASTENSGFGPTKNPWDIQRVPGGSSGGSAAAVAADECIFALGTDTGGSIRQPAGFCNISGLKPTYGACSRYGLLAMASSFDCPGPMTKTVEDCEIVFDWMKGSDPNDATTSESKDKFYNRSQVTIGLPKEFFGEGIDSEVKKLVTQAANFFEKLGYRLQEISLPHTKYSIAAYYILVPSEISSNMARYDGIRFGQCREVLEDEVKRRIMLGTYTLSAGYFDQYFAKASKIRNLIKQDYLKAFETVDIILGPISPTPPFKIGEMADDPLKMYLADILTVGANLSGIPGLALPCGFTDTGLPVGMQLLGPHFSEKLLFNTGKIYQEHTDWQSKKPSLSL